MAWMGRLRTAGLAVAYFLPPFAAVLSSRSAAALLSVGLILTIASTQGTFAKWLQNCRGVVSGAPRTSAILVLLLLLALASSLWSLSPTESLEGAAKLILMTLIGLGWYASMDEQDMKTIFWCLAAGSAAAAGVLVLALGETSSLVSGFNNELSLAKYNSATLITLLFATAALSLGTGFSRQHIAIAIIAYAFTGVAVFLSQSETAKLLFLLFPFLWLIFWLTPAPLKAWTGVLPLALYAAFPLLAPLLDDVITALSTTPLQPYLVQGAAGARVQLWNQFLDAAMQNPLLGWGFATDKFIPLTMPDGATYTDVWAHPHSLPIQALTNLGGLGFVLLGGLLAAFAIKLARKPQAEMAAPYALLTCLMVTWCISHGAWQSWWIAILALLLTAILPRTSGERK